MFVDRERELEALEGFWRSGRAECIPVTGRRRVGKTYLLEHLAVNKRAVYFRCQLEPTERQLPRLGAALAGLSGDAVLQEEPPSTWPGVWALVERLCARERLLLVIDEVPYWASRDPALPSVLQNWWDARGRNLDLMLVLCGSAVQMMEHLLSGEAPLAGCVTGRLPVRPLDFRGAAELLRRDDPVEALACYGILGGVPLYLTFFWPDRSLRENIRAAIASPSARLYVEPMSLFASHHEAYDVPRVMAVLRAIARGRHRWSEIADASRIPPASLARVMTPLLGDMAVVERELPITESAETRTYRTRYHVTDDFLRFWFRFIEPHQGEIEFGGGDGVTEAILAELSDYLGPPFEAMCRDWVRLASAAGILEERASRVGRWWDPNHDVDMVALDERRQVALVGEAKWTARPFGWEALERFQAHVRALATAVPVRPDVQQVLFCRSGFDARVARWAADTSARLLTPQEMLAPFGAPA